MRFLKPYNMKKSAVATTLSSPLHPTTTLCPHRITAGLDHSPSTLYRLRSLGCLTRLLFVGLRGGVSSCVVDWFTSGRFLGAAFFFGVGRLTGPVGSVFVSRGLGASIFRVVSMHSIIFRPYSSSWPSCISMSAISKTTASVGIGTWNAWENRRIALCCSGVMVRLQVVSAKTSKDNSPPRKR
jgi:hypothetical protein